MKKNYITRRDGLQLSSEDFVEVRMFSASKDINVNGLVACTMSSGEVSIGTAHDRGDGKSTPLRTGEIDTFGGSKLTYPDPFEYPAHVADYPKVNYLRTSSFDVNFASNFRNLKQRELYRDYITGVASASLIGMPSDSASMNNLTAQAPSWTGAGVEKKHAYVIPAYSSSLYDHNLKNRNAWFSGTEALESSVVPASSSMFYRKPSTIVTKTWKVTGSIEFASGTDPLAAGTWKWSWHSASYGPWANLEVAAGNNPSRVLFNVEDYGKLIDIKVWVELCHMSGTNNWNTSTGPLASFSMCLTCPNLPIRCGNPFFNEGKLADLSNFRPNDIDPTLHGLTGFILWEQYRGSVLNQSDADVQYPNNASFNSGSWGKDRHMRTVFWDGTREGDYSNSSDANRIYNLYNLYGLYEDGAYKGRGPAAGELGISLHVGQNPRYLGLQDENTSGSDPFDYRIRASNAPNNFYGFVNLPTTPPETRVLEGNDYPWMSDATLNKENTSHQVTGSPPNGWLTAPGGVADECEWPTTGINFGPHWIRPMWPLLDDIVTTIDSWSFFDGSTFSSFDQYMSNFTDLKQQDIVGFRPGLRGVEVNGQWSLIIEPYTLRTHFRQARLELTFLSGSVSGDIGNYRDLLFKKSSLVQREDLSPKIFSGCFIKNWSTFQLAGIDPLVGGDRTGRLYIVPKDENNFSRTKGISYLTSSFNADGYAVFSRITGSLLTTLIARDTSSIDPTHWYLNNEFGTPMIPDSTGSGESIFPQQLVQNDAQAAKVFVRKLVSPDLEIRRGMEDVGVLLKEEGAEKSMRDIAQDLVTEHYSARSGSA